MLALLLNPEDTVATALSDAASGDTAEIILGREKTGRSVTALDAIPFGFKIAVRPMKKGNPVISTVCRSALRAATSLRVHSSIFITLRVPVAGET